MSGCAILEFDNLWNFCRVKELPHATGSDNYSKQKPALVENSQKCQEAENWNDLHMQNQSCFGVFLIAAPDLIP